MSKEIKEFGMEIDIKKNNKLARARLISLVISGMGIVAATVCSYLKDKNCYIFGEFNEDGSFQDYESYDDEEGVNYEE